MPVTRTAYDFYELIIKILKRVIPVCQYTWLKFHVQSIIILIVYKYHRVFNKMLICTTCQLHFNIYLNFV